MCNKIGTYNENISLYQFFLLLGLSAFLFSSCSKSYSCEDYKIGTFKYDDDQFDAVITRTATQQIEISDSLNYKDVFQVIWTNDCFYKLILQSTDNPARMPLSMYDTIYVKIGEVDKKGYSFDAEVLDQKPSGRLIKLKEEK